jgi:chemotaxis signal transduction protein
VKDLACLLGAGEGRTDARRRLIVVRPSDGAVFGGVIVDEVHRIRDLPSKAFRPAESAAWADPAYLTAFFVEDGEPLALLDMTRLLRSEALQQFAAQRSA